MQFTQEESSYLTEVIFMDLKHTFVSLSESYLEIANKIQGFTLTDCKKDFKERFRAQLSLLSKLDQGKYNTLLEYIKNFRYSRKTSNKYAYLYS